MPSLLKRRPLPKWTVKVTVMYKRRAQKGFKLTDSHGGKSVTIDVWKDEDMPVDNMGNITDIIVDDNSTIKRLIKGKPHEHYIGASARDTVHRIQDWVAKYEGNIPDDVYEEVFEHLLGWYKIVSPWFYDLLDEFKPDIKEHVDAVLRDNKLFCILPTDAKLSYLDVNRLLEKHYPACCGPVTLTNYRGEKVTTVNNMVIGNMYYMLLEKIANDFSAVSSAKLQHFGLPSKPSNANKYSSPIKMSPVRFGESEYRLFVATAGGKATADLADRSTNVVAHEVILNNLLNADKPTNVQSLIDRTQIPIGDGFIQKIIHHELSTLGVKQISKEQTDEESR